MHGSFSVGTSGGIAIRVHHTWFFAVVLIAWSLALGSFPSASQGRGSVADWVLAIAAALLLFGSVLVHELGHSLVARARGLRVEDITLFIFGGISSIAQEATTPGDEFLIAVVGLLISLALAGVWWVVGQLVPVESAFAVLARYLAVANLLLGLFNSVPGFPLDGGRGLRAILWAATGDLTRATRLAAYVGQAVAFGLIGWGVVSVVSGDPVDGLWIGLIGWFLKSGAEGSRRQLEVRRAPEGVLVTSVMDRSPLTAAPGLSARDFVQDYALRGHRALPVIDGGQLLGIVSITAAQRVAQDAWAPAPVAEIMTRTPLTTLPPEADLSAALELMVVASGVLQLPIVRDGVPIGLLSRADVLRYLQLGPGLQRPGAQPASATASPQLAPSGGELSAFSER